MKILFSLIVLVMSSASQASGWSHIYRSSLNGANIQVGYTNYYDQKDGCLKCVHPTKASNIWININGGQIRPTDSIRVVFLNFMLGNSSYSQKGVVEMKQYQVDLQWDAINNRFTGTPGVDIPIITSGYPGTWYYYQEIAIVVNGHWLKDRTTGSTNFYLNLYNNIH